MAGNVTWEITCRVDQGCLHCPWTQFGYTPKHTDIYTHKHIFGANAIYCIHEITAKYEFCRFSYTGPDLAYLKQKLNCCVRDKMQVCNQTEEPHQDSIAALCAVQK